MAKKTKRLPLDPAEYALVYKAFVSVPGLENIAAQRQMNALLDDLEALGDPVRMSPAEQMAGTPPTYEVTDDVVLELTATDEGAFKLHLGGAVSRFQAWYARPIPAIIDRLEALEAEE